MKRLLTVFLCVLILVVPMANAVAENQYTVVLPAWVENEDYNPLTAGEQMGITFVDYDANSNLVFTISETARTEALAEFEVSWAEMVDSTVNDETGLFAVSSMEHNDDYTEISIYLDKDQVGFEAMLTMVLPIQAWGYQVFMGCMPDEFVCNIVFYDTNKEPVETITLHDAELQEFAKSLREKAAATEDTDENGND